ncbi:hypothetical protein [Streptomyces crystallinus]|uniref:hypothetical protein n=1 Tax=Streptomyces crystallinus TaxID=68191 RepID=UPI0031DA7CC9
MTWTDQRDAEVEALSLPVRSVLHTRATALRDALPPRPAFPPPCRYAWWRCLDEDQARTAALLDHLDTLVAHLDGVRAGGYGDADALRAALEAADGFALPHLADALVAYRHAATAAAP